MENIYSRLLHFRWIIHLAFSEIISADVILYRNAKERGFHLFVCLGANDVIFFKGYLLEGFEHSKALMADCTIPIAKNKHA